jgi:hypothetical protein
MIGGCSQWQRLDIRGDMMLANQQISDDNQQLDDRRRMLLEIYRLSHLMMLSLNGQMTSVAVPSL